MEKNRKNIAFLCKDLSVVGGSEKVTTDVANTLCDYHNIHMLALVDCKPLIPLDDRITYQCLNIDIDKGRMRQYLLPLIMRLKSYYKKNKIDMCIIVENQPAYVCAPTSLVTHTKQVFYTHTGMMNQWDDLSIRRMKRVASKLCDYTIVLTEKSKQASIELFHVNPKKVVTIYNWIDVDKYKPQYSEDNHVIISAGRLSGEKCFHTHLIEVAKLVQQKHPDWQWHIYGDGQYRHEMELKIKEYNLQDFLILKGMVNNLDNIYKNYGIYVMTSYREGLPLVLLEAKASGIPMVAFDVDTGPSEIIDHDKDGLLIPPMNDEIMAKAICSLIENPEMRMKFSQHALETINFFSKSKILKTWMDFIAQV